MEMTLFKVSIQFFRGVLQFILVLLQNIEQIMDRFAGSRWLECG